MLTFCFPNCPLLSLSSFPTYSGSFPELYFQNQSLVIFIALVGPHIKFFIFEIILPFLEKFLAISVLFLFLL